MSSSKNRTRKRWIAMAVLAAASAALSLVSVFHNPWLSLNACAEHPAEYDGRLVEHFREPVIADLFPDGFLLAQKKGPSIRVLCDTAGLVRGEYVGIKAVFHKEGTLDHAVLQLARGRRDKMAVSAVPAVFICVWFLARFRWSRRKGGLEPRFHA